jgi:TonB family protein
LNRVAPPVRTSAALFLLVAATAACLANPSTGTPVRAERLAYPECGPDVLALPQEAFAGRSAEEVGDSLRGAGLLPAGSAVRLAAFTAAPEPLDRRALARLLEVGYPPLLRDLGIGGTVHLAVFIDSEGLSRATLIERGSGYDEMDDAARLLLTGVRFEPAAVEGCRTRSFLSLPVTFRTRSP